MRAPAQFASDPTTQPAYRAQNRPEQGRPSEDRTRGFTPWGRPGNSPGHDRPSAHYRHWPFRCCSSPVTAPTNVAPLPERWTTNVAVQNWKSQATPRVIEPPTTPRPNRQAQSILTVRDTRRKRVATRGCPASHRAQNTSPSVTNSAPRRQPRPQGGSAHEPHSVACQRDGTAVDHPDFQ